MQRTALKYSTATLQSKFALMGLANVWGRVFITVGVLLIGSVPAYAGNIGDKDMEQTAAVGDDSEAALEKMPVNVVHVKVDSKDMVAVDLYGDGTLMLGAPSHGRKKITKTTAAEVYDYLAPIPAEARSMTVEKIGNRIFIRSATREHVPSRLARRQVMPSPVSSASRLIRSKNAIAMNSIPQE